TSDRRRFIPEPTISDKPFVPDTSLGGSELVALSDETPASGFNVGDPTQLKAKLFEVGYQCLDFIAVQISLVLNTPSVRPRALLLEGPSGCGKSFMAKSLAKITGAKMMCLSCYEGMNTDALLESQSMVAVSKALAGRPIEDRDLINLGVIARAFKASQEGLVILLIDELDKADPGIDTFFLGPIQDGAIHLQSQDQPLVANPDNILLIFTKNMNRVLDQALLRRMHPITMTYLDSELEKNIL
ncbi:MAG: AAA family ATPase, partial [Bdellovibrionales bacterium]|nr:AAA family ATPase [Bdellovibrionales bacterium]